MPLHLLGKKSWNVYNADNIARVKADEAAAAAREAAHEQHMQELDAERRAALLRGRTPPPLPEEDKSQHDRYKRDQGTDDQSRARKKRKLAGEDDTDMDIRLAKSITAPRRDGDADARVLKLRSTENDAPLTNHAGNIALFPVNMKEAIKRERNMEAEKEKRQKARALEDQYTMRFSNAAGFKTGLSQPWYAAAQDASSKAGDGTNFVDQRGFEHKDVWGNEDSRRKERDMMRITSNDPFAFMQKAQAQLKKSKEDRKKWAEERNRDMRELRADTEREDRRHRHRDRRTSENDRHRSKSGKHRRDSDKDRSSKRKHRHKSPARDHDWRRDTKQVKFEGEDVFEAKKTHKSRNS